MKRLLCSILFSCFLLSAALAQLSGGLLFPGPGLGKPSFTVTASGIFNGTSTSQNRTLGTPTSGKTWTANWWFKASSYGTTVMWSDSAANLIWFNSGTFSFTDTSANITATSTPSDTTTWHNYQVIYDSTQVTSTNRVHLIVDGVDVTNTGGTFPTLNANSGLFASTDTVYFGTDINGGPRLWMNGKAALAYFVDGQNLAASTFTSGTGSGTTHPKASGLGSLGTNGSWVTFCSNGGLGHDDGTGAQCSNAGSNNWTNTNVTQSTSDVPS